MGKVTKVDGVVVNTSDGFDLGHLLGIPEMQVISKIRQLHDVWEVPLNTYFDRGRKSQRAQKNYESKPTSYSGFSRIIRGSLGFIGYNVVGSVASVPLISSGIVDSTFNPIFFTVTTASTFLIPAAAAFPDRLRIIKANWARMKFEKRCRDLFRLVDEKGHAALAQAAVIQELSSTWRLWSDSSNKKVKKDVLRSLDNIALLTEDDSPLHYGNIVNVDVLLSLRNALAVIEAKCAERGIDVFDKVDALEREITDMIDEVMDEDREVIEVTGREAQTIDSNVPRKPTRTVDRTRHIFDTSPETPDQVQDLYVTFTHL